MVARLSALSVRASKQAKVRLLELELALELELELEPELALQGTLE